MVLGVNPRLWLWHAESPDTGKIGLHSVIFAVGSIPLSPPNTCMPVSTPVQEQETVSPQKPVKTIRLRGVSASIFANKVKVEGRDRTFHKISVQRAYKEGDDWKHTSSFGRDDAPVLILVLKRAWEFIVDTEAMRGKEEEAE